MQRNQIPQKLSDLRDHKFKYTFQDTLNQFCLCGIDVETNMHFFLYCPFLIYNQRCTLLSTVIDVDSSLTNTIIIYFFGKFSIDSISNIPADIFILNGKMIF